MTDLVYSAMFGGYDTVRPVGLDRDRTDFVLFTDAEELADDTGWDVRVVHSSRVPDGARWQARWYKLHPPDGYDRCVWLNMSAWPPHSTPALNVLFDGCDGPGPAAHHAHPHRCCVYDEAEASLRENWGKYGGFDLAGQVDSYRQAGLPGRWGLWETASMSFTWDRPTRRFFAAWWEEVARWGWHDQLAEPYVAWSAGTRPDTLPGNFLDWFPYHSHARND